MLTNHRSPGKCRDGMGKPIELRQLRYFVAVAEELNFGRAYRGELGQLVLGVAPMLEASACAALTSRIKKTCPHLQIKCQVLESREQVAMVRDGRLDAGLVRLPLEEHDFLTVEFLFREPLVVIMRDDNPLARRSAIRIRDLSGQNRVTTRKKLNTAFYGYIDSLCHRGGYRDGRVRTVNTIPELMSAVARGDGIAIVPSSFKRQMQKGMHCVRLRDRNTDIEVGLIYRRNHHPPTVNILQRSTNQTQWPNVA